MSVQTSGTPHLRPLNRPRRVIVETGNDGAPTGIRLANNCFLVESVIEAWRIDDEWWRERPVSRMYYRVALEDGRVVDLYRALGSGRWYRQSY